MGFNDFFGLTLGVQVALGSGYLAYATSYAGFRKAHHTEDTVFISLAFGSLAFLVFNTLAPCGQWCQSLGAFAVSLIAGCLWRGVLRGLWQQLISLIRVHREDGIFSPWDAIVQTRRRVGQVSVHTKNGRVLHLIDRSLYSGTQWDGLYLGGDGGIAMVVQEEDLSDGTTEHREGISDPEWGTRLTYIPASEIERVNIRLK